MIWITITHAASLLLFSVTLVMSIDVQDIVDGSDVQAENIWRSDLYKTFLQMLSEPSTDEAKVDLMMKLIKENNNNGILKSVISKTGQLGLRDLLKEKERVLLIKKLKPKFNPTGWRRKRDLSDHQEWNGDIKALLWKNIHSNAFKPEPPAFLKRDPMSYHRYAFRGGQFKLKRKPLKFNPTGW